MGLSESITVRVGADISHYRAQMGKVLTTTKAASRAIRQNFSRIRLGIQQTGVAMSATIGLASGLAIKASAEFEKELRLISTLIDTNEEGLRRLGAIASESAQTFGTSTLSNLRAIYDGLSASVIDAATAQEFLTNANKAAVAGNVETAVATEGIIRLMAAYEEEALSAGKASDILFTIVKKGVTRMGELAPNIGRLAGVAAAAGVSIEQMAAALATATKTAKTPEAVVQITQLIQSIVKPAEEAEEAADRLSIGFDAVTLATKGLSGVMDGLRDAIGMDTAKELNRMILLGADFSEVQKEMATTTGLTIGQIVKFFPNIRALRGALALLSNEGKRFNENLEAMKDSQGETAKQYEKMSKTAVVAFGQLKESVFDALREIGDALVPHVKELAAGIKTVVKDVVEWIKANPELVKQIAEWTVKVAGAAAVLLPLGMALSAIGGIFSFLWGVIGIGITVFQLLFGVIAALFTPIGAIVALVAVVIAGVVLLWDEFVAFFGDLPRIFGMIWDDIVSAVVGVWTGFLAWWAKQWKQFTKNWDEGWERVGKAFEDLWEGIADFFVGIWEGIVDAFEASVQFFVDIWDTVSSALVYSWETVWGGISDFFMGIIDGIKNAWQAAVDFILGLWDSISGFFESVGDFFGSIASGVIEFLGFHEGGWIGGPGGRDNVPVMAERGEFVVNREAAADFGPLLEAINSMGGSSSPSLSFGGGLTLELPNVRQLDRDGVRLLTEELDRLSARNLRSTNRRGIR